MLQVKVGRPYDGSRPIKSWVGQMHSEQKIPHAFVSNAIERCVRIKGVSNNVLQLGTGVIIQTGLIISNYHLLEDRMFVNDHTAEILHWDIRSDLVALIAITRRLRRAVFQETHYRTQAVFYVGNPEEENKSVTRGAVTWYSQTKIKTSNPPAKGMSGSGLYDVETGRLIGLVDSMEGSEENGCNFTVAVPATIVEQFYRDALFKLRFRRE